MAQAAQIRAVTAPDAGPRVSALQRLLAPTLMEPEPPAAPAVVSLFAEEPPEVAEEPGLADADWPAAIQMIRDVAARVRQARAEAAEAGRRADVAAERSTRQVEEAEARLQVAQADTRAALLRAEAAEAAAEAAEARARTAEEDMRAAQAARNEAQTWLKRLYASVLTEFEGLTDDPVALGA